MPKVLIMVDNGFEDAEFIYTYYRFQEEGYQVEVVAPRAKETYKGQHGVPTRSDLSPKEAKVDKYHALIIPGGKAPDRMRAHKGLVNIVKEFYEKGKVIASICYGPKMLIEADILRGKKATCYWFVARDLENAGATFIDTPVVVDENLVTSRFPGDLPKFCQETIKILQNNKHKSIIYFLKKFSSPFQKSRSL
ncbi:MAG: type 1 glutamine amidotransferase domain-containing protein [Candidatus Bathyarchaeia archaeon]